MPNRDIRYIEADNVRSRSWWRIECDWQQFAGQLCERRTIAPCTLAHYQDLKSAVQRDGTKKTPSQRETDADEIAQYKDVACFVGGDFEPTTPESVYCMRRAPLCTGRDMVTLDFDDAPDERTTRAWIESALKDWEYLVYSTISHTPDKARLRVIVPLDRTATPAEYDAIAHWLGNGIKMDWCDPTSFRLTQAMYYPVRLLDVEPVWMQHAGEFLAADHVLSQFDWSNPLNIPRHRLEKKNLGLFKSGNGNGSVKPATEKQGMIGVFNRTYSVSDGIREFLTDKYAPIDGRSYSFLQSSCGQGGCDEFIDGYFRSFHATDPASGHAVSVYDLVRIHRFGDLDESLLKDTDNASVNKSLKTGGKLPKDLPSVKAMNDWMLTLPKVQETIQSERQEKVKADFDLLADLREASESIPHETIDDDETDETAQQVVDDENLSKAESKLAVRLQTLAGQVIDGKGRTDVRKLAQYTAYDNWVRPLADGDAGNKKYGVYHTGGYIVKNDLGLEEMIQGEYDKLGGDGKNMTAIKRALSYIKNMPAIGTFDKLNDEEWPINFRDGLLDWESMTMRKHTPKLLSSVQLPLDWPRRPSPTPVFDSYINHLTKGDEDAQRLLLEYAGVTLSNIKGYQFKKVLFLQGEGNSGKSQFIMLLQEILGENNWTVCDLEALEKHKFMAAQLYGKRLGANADIGFMRVPELFRFKQLAAGDNIIAEHKGEKPFTFQFRGTLLFGCNEAPLFGGDTGQHVYDRIILLPCGEAIRPEDRDPKILRKMLAETPGIVYKAVLAMRDAVRRGYRYTIPESTVKRQSEYNAENSTAVTHWQEEMETTTDAAYKCPTVKQVFGHYVDWHRRYYPGNSHVLNRTEYMKSIAGYLRGCVGDVFVNSNHQYRVKGWKLRNPVPDFDELRD